VVVRSKPRLDATTPDLNHGVMPDVIGETLISLMQRIDDLEGRVSVHEEHVPPVHMPEHGVWRGEDFSI
jgi:hypothetical protein